MQALNLRMPFRFLRGSYSRLLLTVVALACGVALVCAIDLVNRAVLRAFMEVIDTMAGRAALQVTAGGDGVFPEEVADAVAEIRGVRHAIPIVSATAFTTDEEAEALTIHGMDLTSDAALAVYESAPIELEDELAFLNQSDSILLTRDFARKRRLGVGSAFLLETPHGRRSFTLRGLLDPEGVARAYGGNLAVMDLFAAEAAFTRAGYVNRVDVVLDSGEDLAGAAAAIESSLPPGLRVEMPAQRKADIQRAMQSLNVLLQSVGMVVLLAAFLIAFNRLSCVFEARAWQMGVLRAVGLGSRRVWRELLKESALLGLAGVALGVPLGIGLARLLLPVIAATTELNYKLVVPDSGLQLSLTSLGLAAGVGVAAAVLAAMLPAWRTARISPMEAIRGKGVEAPDRSRALLLALRLAAVATLGGALVAQSLTRHPMWGIAATLAIVAITALAARPLLEAMNPLWAGLLCRVFGPAGRFAVAFARLNPRRTARAAGMLGVGLGSVLWLGMIAHSFRASALDNLSQAMRADLIVSSMHVSSGYLEVPVDDALVEALSALEGVDSAVGVRVRDWEHEGGEIALDAFDPGYFRDKRFGEWPLLRAAGDRDTVWEEVARGTGVVVSSNFLLNLGGDVGETVRLTTPSGPLDLRIVGVTTDFASPRGTIEMSREVYARHWHDSHITRAFVRVRSGADPAAVRDEITRVLGASHRLRVISSGDLMRYFAEQITRAFAPLDVLAMMVLLVVMVGMSDTIAAGMIERTRDLGAMRAIGAQRHDIRRLAIVEALLPGSLGYVLAVAAGLALGSLWVTTTFPYLLGWVLEVQVPWFLLGWTAVVTIVVCFLGALWPAMRAARLEVTEALRCE